MKHFILQVGVSLLFFASLVACEENRLKQAAVRYDTPANEWQEWIPLGNEYRGALWKGHVLQEDLVFNDKSLTENAATGAPCSLAEIRGLLEKGEQEEVRDMLEKHFIGGLYTPDSFPLIGNVHLEYSYAGDDAALYTDYERGFSLEEAVAWTRFKVGNTLYKREYFISAADDVLVIRLSADRKEKLYFDVSLTRPEFAGCYSNDGVVVMEGQLVNTDIGKQAAYRVQMQVFQEDGRQVADSAEIHVSGATTAYILVASATATEKTGLEQKLGLLFEKTASIEPDLLQARHVAVWEEFIREDRLILSRLPEHPERRSLPCLKPE